MTLHAFSAFAGASNTGADLISGSQISALGQSVFLTVGMLFTALGLFVVMVSPLVVVDQLASVATGGRPMYALLEVRFLVVLIAGVLGVLLTPEGREVLYPVVSAALALELLARTAVGRFGRIGGAAPKPGVDGAGCSAGRFR